MCIFYSDYVVFRKRSGVEVQCRRCRSPSKSIHGCHSVPKRCVDVTLTTVIVRLLVHSRGPISMA